MRALHVTWELDSAAMGIAVCQMCTTKELLRWKG